MDKAGLETLHVQLSQVQAALAADPGNAELKSLADEVEQLIELTDAHLQTAAAAPPKSDASSSKKAAVIASSGAAVATRTLAAGDECLAKYSGDGNWYPARILSVGGGADNCVYSIVFEKYKNSELVTASEIKPRPSASPSPYQPSGARSQHNGSAAPGKRKLTREEEEEREKKKKKNEKKQDLREKKAKEQQSKQVTWQKFAKKAEKKGVHIAGVAGTSIFKTPENPLGKVGVTGSGQGMTTNSERPSHRFTFDVTQL